MKLEFDDGNDEGEVRGRTQAWGGRVIRKKKGEFNESRQQQQGSGQRWGFETAPKHSRRKERETTQKDTALTSKGWAGDDGSNLVQVGDDVE